MKERRTAERHNLIMYLRVHDRTTDELVGHIVDVSSGGMMLVSDAPFVPKDTHELRFGGGYHLRDRSGVRRLSRPSLSEAVRAAEGLE